ncbi:MAG: class I SAM-dependent methyltransferase [Gemmatimonadales bacterium]
MDTLAIPPGGAILDLGSPKDLAVLLSRRRRCRVVAVDILEETVRLSRRYAAAQGMDGEGAGLVESRVADGRALPFPDHSFDAAFSVSVLEHIPGNGDSAAARELARILRPGGTLAITVPFAQVARDTFVQGAVYERESLHGEPVFFERHYDHSSLRERLLGPSGLVIDRLEIWGEPRGRWERLLGKSALARKVLSPLEPMMSLLFLDPVPPDSSRAMAAFVLLRKAGPT